MQPIYASIDLGGTNLKCAFATPDGEILLDRSIPTESYKGPGHVLEQMITLVSRMEYELGMNPAALGIGIPGLVDREEGFIRFLPNFPGNWRDIPICQPISSRIKCPVFILNDVRTATLGELKFGHGVDASTMVFFALGTGIGGGVVVDGKLRLGPLGAAGELGHQVILPDGPICGCGNHGCLETLASGPAITAIGVRLMRSGLAPILYELTSGNTELITPEIMAQAALKGDKNIEIELLKCAEYVGIGVVNVIVALHPDLVVLGGGIANMGDLLFDTVRKTVKKRVGMFPTSGIEIKPSLLGDSAGLLGGIALAMDGLRNKLQ
jgi:glucokinase